LLEEGGVVLDAIPSSGFVPGTIRGVVRDSRRRGVADAVVRVLGYDVQSVTDPQGRYTLSGVPPGLQFVVAEHQTFRELGVRIGQHGALVSEGGLREIDFSAPTMDVVATMLCGPRRGSNTAILRVTIASGQRASPAAGALVRLAAARTSQTPTYLATIRTDADGSALFCDAPAGVDLILSDPSKPDAALATFRLRRGEVIGWSDRTGRQP
jgi:hypothetical protein